MKRTLFVTLVCSGSLTLAGAHRPITLSHVSSAVSKARLSSSASLYISTGITTSRYPIVNGVVSTQPASTLNAGAAAYHDGIAVAADGTLYMFAVTKGSKQLLAVNVYAPGAAGNDPPIRQIVLQKSDYTYGGIAVDPKGYLYVLVSAPGNVYVFVYAPGASGPATPVQTFHDFGMWLDLDRHGNLYVSDDNQGVRVWANPITKPTMARQICLRDQAAGVAIAPSGNTFVAIQTRWLHRKNLKAIRTYGPRVNACPAPKNSYFRTSPVFSEPGDLVEYLGSLFLTTYGTSHWEVLQFPETGPNPRPVTATITFSDDIGANGLAVGP